MLCYSFITVFSNSGFSCNCVAKIRVLSCETHNTPYLLTSNCFGFRPSFIPQKRSTAACYFSAHVSCGQTVAHLSYCWALVQIQFVGQQRLAHKLYLNKCSAVAVMGDCLATRDMGRKVAGCCAPFLGDKRRSEAEATARHMHWYEMARHSLP